MYNDKKTTKNYAPFVLKEWKGRTFPPPSPVYASKCFLPVSYEVKGKGLCYASALSMSHLISYLSNYTVFFFGG